MRKYIISIFVSFFIGCLVTCATCIFISRTTDSKLEAKIRSDAQLISDNKKQFSELSEYNKQLENRIVQIESGCQRISNNMETISENNIVVTDAVSTVIRLITECKSIIDETADARECN